MNASISLMRAGMAAVLGALICASGARAEPNGIDFAAYFDSDIRDAEECAMSVRDGVLAIDNAITNAAMSCPDMFSWKLFIDTVQEKWWVNWASDTQTWPDKPYKLCEAGVAGKDCCLPGSGENPGYGDVSNSEYPHSQHCPYFPGAEENSKEFLAAARGLGKPVGAHAVILGQRTFAPGFATTAKAAGEPEPGRVIRQEMGEITVRNKAMFDYIFNNDLYNRQGIAKAVGANARNLETNAPYRAKNLPGALSRIDVPIPSIMIKSNWLFHEFAKDLGLSDDPANPYIKNEMVTKVGGKEYRGEHWLMSFHISSKDIPRWVWTTFEHVNNPGRCDFTGCNDSYGYTSSDSRGDADGTEANFTKPKTRNDGLGNSKDIYDLGLKYTSGPIRRQLAQVLSDMEIGTADQVELTVAPADKGWLSYRLKGSQVNFSNSMGRPTRLGNAVTEGGFAITSSCITCHARASVAASGDEKDPLSVPLGVFEYDHLNETGYPQSSMGAPQKDWFHGSASKPEVKAFQTDFMWGMPFFAHPLSEPSQ